MQDKLRKVLAGLIGRFIALLGHVPILGELTRCTASHHKSALREFAVLMMFSTATFWLAAFIAQFIQENRGVNYLTLLEKTVNNGELTIFCVSFLGPIFYTALDNPSWAKRDFPEKMIHAVVAVLLAIAASSLFAISRVPFPKNPDLILDWSIGLAGFAVVLRYLTVLYAKARIDDPSNVWRNSADNFIKLALRRSHDK